MRKSKEVKKVRKTNIKTADLNENRKKNLLTSEHYTIAF